MVFQGVFQWPLLGPKPAPPEQRRRPIRGAGSAPVLELAPPAPEPAPSAPEYYQPEMSIISEYGSYDGEAKKKGHFRRNVLYSRPNPPNLEPVVL